jgi:hypothetical protein
VQPDGYGKQLVMDSFVIVLKNEKLSLYNRIVYLVSIINFSFFIFHSFYVEKGNERVLWIFFSSLILIFCFTESTIREKNKNRKNYFSITYCLLILMWAAVAIWFAFIHIILLMLDTISRRSLQVNFDTNGIGYPSFPKKNIQWNEISNIVLKDGLLTIDFKNNRLIQAETYTNENQVNEIVFNRFCEQQLQ